MNIKVYSMLMIMMMQSPACAMEIQSAARINALTKEWNDAYARYEHAANQDLKYFFLGFCIDPVMTKKERIIKSARLSCHTELTFRVYKNAELQLRASYVELYGHQPLL